MWLTSLDWNVRESLKVRGNVGKATRGLWEVSERTQRSSGCSDGSAADWEVLVGFGQQTLDEYTRKVGLCVLDGVSHQVCKII